MEILAEEIGLRVKEARTAGKETQDELALLLGLEKASISRKERGRVAFSAIELAIISERYAVSVDWLVFGDNAKPSGYTQAEKNLILCYRKIDDESKRLIYDMAVDLALK